MTNKPVLKASEVIYRDKIAIRKDRDLRRKKRLELNKKIDDLLKQVSHIECDKAFFVKGDEKLIMLEIEKLKKELFSLSNNKKYEVEKEIEFKDITKNQSYNSKNLINELRIIDCILTPESIFEMRKTSSLKDIAASKNINYKALRNWCYSRGVNKMFKEMKLN